MSPRDEVRQESLGEPKKVSLIVNENKEEELASDILSDTLEPGGLEVGVGAASTKEAEKSSSLVRHYLRPVRRIKGRLVKHGLRPKWEV